MLIKFLFASEPKQGVKTWSLIILAVILMISDHRYHRVDQLRAYLSQIVFPLQSLVSGFVQGGASLNEYVISHYRLIQENVKLREEQVIQNARLQKLIALESENDRLRALLHATPRVGENFLVAEIIQVDSDPLSHHIILNKGLKEGIYVGQPVIDAEGVMGEVIEVFPETSRVILLTDANHGIPVETVRNRIRGIAMGCGAAKTLALKHVSNAVDIQVGDVLVTSGLGGRYPAGYPVGVIKSIEQDPRGSFAVVQMTPSAHLERGRQVLLIQKVEG